MSANYQDHLTRAAPWLQLPQQAAALLRPVLSQASERAIDAIHAEIPAYHRPLTGDFGRLLRAVVDGALMQFVDLIEEAEADALGTSRLVYYDLGRAEFQEGRPLDALLGAYNVGARVAWQEIVATCDELEPETLYLLAEAVFAYINELSAVSAAGYSAEQAATAGAAQAAYQNLVELLAGHPSPDPAILGLAADNAGWELPEEVVAIALPDGEPSRFAMRVGPRAIAGRIGNFVCILIPAEEVAGAAALESVPAVSAAVGPTVPLPDTAVSWEWARRALRLMQTGLLDQRGLIRAEDHLATLLLHGDERLAGEFVERWLAPLQTLSERSRQGLPQTLLTWLSHHQNYVQTAAALHLHAHTVRYRMDKVRQLYGATLDDPDARFELELALRVAGLRASGTAGSARAARVTGEMKSDRDHR